VKAEELRFTDDGLKEMTRRVLLPWYNSFKFFMTYAEVDGWSPKKHFLQGENILDRWILSKLQTLTLEVNREMESYRLYNVVPALFSFIEDLTNWYIRLNRRRFWEEGLPETKREAYSTLYSTLVQVSQLMAPFTPFLADYTFKEMKKLGGLSKESVHLETYPEAILKLKDSKLEIAVSKMQQVIELGRQKRLQEQIKIKTPLRSITVIHQDQEILDGLKKLEEYIQGELNIKTILYSTDEHKFIRLTSKPNSPILGKKMGKDFGMMRAQIEKISSQDLIRFENGESLTLGSYQLSGDDLLLFREALPGSHAVSNKFMTISMDCVLDQNLIDEGLAREMINRIQKNRKDSKLNVSDRIKIDLDGSDKLKAVFLKHLTYISQETLIAQHDWVSKNHEFTEYEIEGDFFALKISKL
jgi:isoleucyl-tRNA synthetase